MAVIAPPSRGREKKKEIKEDKGYFSRTLTAQMKRLVTLDDGRQLSVAEAATERLVNIMLYAESNQDAIAAAKIVFDRTEGKPAVIKDDTAKPIPKVTIRLNGEQYDKGRGLSEVEMEEDVFEEEEPKMRLEFDDGKVYEG